MESFIASENCMGQPVAYWQAERKCSDGKTVLATGSTRQQAVESVEYKRHQHEEYLSRTPIEQLREICAGDLLDTDQRTAIRLIAKILDKKETV